MTDTITVTGTPIRCKGKGARKREVAFAQIAPLSLLDYLSRDDMLQNLEAAFGDDPTSDELTTARDQHIIGRVAVRCEGDGDVARLEAARDVTLNFASHGVKSVPKGKLGTRTKEQQTAYNAAKKHFSDACAEIVATTTNDALCVALRKAGFGGALTQGKANKRKRAAAMKGSTARGKGDKQTSEAAKPDAKPKPLTASDACEHVANQLAALTQFCHKYGDKVDGELGDIVRDANKRAIKRMAALAEA